MDNTAENSREKARGLSRAHKERAKGMAREARGRHGESRPERGNGEERRQEGGRGPRDEIKERIANLRARRKGG